jgi:hypothetical protein
MTISPQYVRVTAIPPGLPQGDLNTPELFEKCLGHSFEVISRNGDFLELAIGEVMGSCPISTRFGLSHNILNFLVDIAFDLNIIFRKIKKEN